MIKLMSISQGADTYSVTQEGSTFWVNHNGRKIVACVSYDIASDIVTTILGGV